MRYAMNCVRTLIRLRSTSQLHVGVAFRGSNLVLCRWSPAISITCKPIHSSAHLHQVQKERTDRNSSDLDVQRDRPYEHLSFGQKVVQAGTDLSYLLIIAAGVGVTGILLYTLGSDLFSKSGPNSVYNAAVKKCMNSTQVSDCLGAPLTAYGEGRRRRQHVQHVEFVTNDGEKHTRVQFHLKGQFRTAIVHAETYINEEGSRQFQYLIVECEGYPPRSIQLEKRVKPTSPDSVTFY